MARPSGRDLHNETIEAAREAIQRTGPKFSYTQLAGQLDVRAPSLHHHFPRKQDLIAETTRRYIDEFQTRVDALPAGRALERLEAYTALFSSAGRGGRVCLCGAIAADWHDADTSTRSAIRRFFSAQISWVETEVRHGAANGDLRGDVDPRAFAEAFVGALEGVLMLARTSRSNRSMLTAPSALLQLLTPG